MSRRNAHRQHTAVRHGFAGHRTLQRPRQGPRIVRLNEAGIQRRGGVGERGLLYFGEGCVTAGGRGPDSPLFQRH